MREKPAFSERRGRVVRPTAARELAGYCLGRVYSFNPGNLKTGPAGWRTERFGAGPGSYLRPGFPGAAAA